MNPVLMVGVVLAIGSLCLPIAAVIFLPFAIAQEGKEATLEWFLHPYKNVRNTKPGIPNSWTYWVGFCLIMPIGLLTLTVGGLIEIARS